MLWQKPWHIFASFPIAIGMFFLAVEAADPPYGQLSVEGKYLKGESGGEVQLIGMSLFWSQWMSQFWTAETIQELKCKWKVNLVRAAMGVDTSQQGYLSDKSQLTLLYTVVDAAIAEGIYVIIDWHTYSQDVTNAKDFFEMVSKKYTGVPNVLYEDFNEPMSVAWSDLKTNYHEVIIKVIRANDPKNVIIVGTPNWDQDVDIACKDQITDQINIMYALHFYAGTHKEDKIAKAQTAVDAQCPLFVTEYGTVNADGGGGVDKASTEKWWKFLDENKISYANWSVANKDEGASVLKPGSTPSDLSDESKFTESGKLVYEKIISMDTGITGCSDTTTPATGK